MCALFFLFSFVALALLYVEAFLFSLSWLICHLFIYLFYFVLTAVLFVGTGDLIHKHAFCALFCVFFFHEDISRIYLCVYNAWLLIVGFPSFFFSQGLTKTLQWEKALDLFRSMMYQNVKPDLLSYNSIIACLVKAHRPSM